MTVNRMARVCSVIWMKCRKHAALLYSDIVRVCFHGVITYVTIRMFWSSKVSSCPQEQQYHENNQKDTQQIEKNNSVVVFWMHLDVISIWRLYLPGDVLDS